MVRPITLALVTAALLSAQSGPFVEAIEASPNRIVTTYRNQALPKTAGARAAYVTETDMVFPHIATGGGWETVMVLVNLSLSTADFNLHFFGEDGKPMQVTFRTFPDGKLMTMAAAHAVLPPANSFNFALFDATPNTQVGWVALDYNTSTTETRIGGYAAFRYKSGGVINEGLVPLSSYEDETFFMPFDNIEGFATGIALTNPGSHLSTDIEMVAFDTSGNQLGETDKFTLGPGQHISYVLADRLPALKGKTGSLLFQGSTTMLSAVGIRMNLAGGMTFTSIPVLNWEGMVYNPR